MKRRGITTSCVRLGPSVGCALGSVGSDDKALGYVGCVGDAHVVADEKYGRCGGFLAPCEAGRGVRLRAEDPVLIARNVVGHDTHQGSGDLATVGPVLSSRLSLRLSVCPPPVRSAPGSSSFPSCSIPLRSVFFPFHRLMCTHVLLLAVVV